MTRAALIILLFSGAAACERKAPAAAAPKAVAAEPQRHLRQGGDDRKPSAPIDVVVNGKPTRWTAEQLDAIPVLDLLNKNGEARQGWALRDLAARFVGPQARVVAVVGAGGARLAVDSKDWQDPSKFLVLKVSHKGDYKLHWASRDGSADDAVLKGVHEIDLAQ